MLERKKQNKSENIHFYRDGKITNVQELLTVLEEVGIKFSKYIYKEKKLKLFLEKYAGQMITKELFVDFVKNTADWSFCDCCGTIEDNFQLHWIDGEPLDEGRNAYSDIFKLSDFDAVCDNCHDKYKKSKEVSRSDIDKNLKTTGVAYAVGDVAILHTSKEQLNEYSEDDFVTKHQGVPLTIKFVKAHDTKTYLVEENDKYFTDADFYMPE